MRLDLGKIVKDLEYKTWPVLDLTGTNLTNNDIARIVDEITKQGIWFRLKGLILTNCGLTNDRFIELFNRIIVRCKDSLELMDLSENVELSDGIVKYLSQLTALEFLALKNTQISQSQAKNLSQHYLFIEKIYHNKSDVVSIFPEKFLRNLAEASLSEVNLENIALNEIEINRINRAVQSNPHFQPTKLILKNTGISNQNLIDLLSAPAWLNLEILDISNNDQLDDQAIIRVLPKLIYLQTVDAARTKLTVKNAKLLFDWMLCVKQFYYGNNIGLHQRDLLVCANQPANANAVSLKTNSAYIRVINNSENQFFYINQRNNQCFRIYLASAMMSAVVQNKKLDRLAKKKSDEILAVLDKVINPNDSSSFVLSLDQTQAITNIVGCEPISADYQLSPDDLRNIIDGKVTKVDLRRFSCGQIGTFIRHVMPKMQGEIKELLLSETNIDNGYVKAILKSISNQVETLLLDDNKKIDDDVLPELLNLGKQFKTLDIRGTGLTHEAVGKLAQQKSITLFSDYEIIYPSERNSSSSVSNALGLPQSLSYTFEKENQPLTLFDMTGIIDYLIRQGSQLQLRVLAFRNCQLTDEIINALFSSIIGNRIIESLEILDLSGNPNLTSAILPLLKKLKNIEQLYLIDTGIIKKATDAAALATNLPYLELCFYAQVEKISLNLPVGLLKKIGTSETAFEINCNGYPLSNAEIARIVQVAKNNPNFKVKSLQLKDCDLNNGLLTELLALPNCSDTLEFLDISNNINLTNAIVEQLTEYRFLNSLIMNGLNLAPLIIYDLLHQLPCIHKVQFDNHTITFANYFTLYQIDELKSGRVSDINLDKFDIRPCQIEELCQITEAGMVKITKLSLATNRLTNEMVIALLKAPGIKDNLKFLYLENNSSLNDDLYKYLVDLPNLELLNICHTGITEFFAKVIFAKNSKLQKLFYGDNFYLKRDGNSVQKNKPSIPGVKKEWKSVTISPQFESDKQYIMGMHKKIKFEPRYIHSLLESADRKGCIYISDALISVNLIDILLSNNAKYFIRSLIFINCEFQLDAISLFKNFPHLINIRFDSCKIGNAEIFALDGLQLSLEKLIIWNSHNVTDKYFKPTDNLANFFITFAKLVYLNIRETDINPHTARKIFFENKNIQLLDFGPSNNESGMMDRGLNSSEIEVVRRDYEGNWSVKSRVKSEKSSLNNQTIEIDGEEFLEITERTSLKNRNSKLDSIELPDDSLLLGESSSDNDGIDLPRTKGEGSNKKNNHDAAKFGNGEFSKVTEDELLKVTESDLVGLPKEDNSLFEEPLKENNDIGLPGDEGELSLSENYDNNASKSKSESMPEKKLSKIKLPNRLSNILKTNTSRGSGIVEFNDDDFNITENQPPKNKRSDSKVMELPSEHNPSSEQLPKKQDKGIQLPGDEEAESPSSKGRVKKLASFFKSRGAENSDKPVESHANRPRSGNARLPVPDLKMSDHERSKNRFPKLSSPFKSNKSSKWQNELPIDHLKNQVLVLKNELKSITSAQILKSKDEVLLSILMTSNDRSLTPFKTQHSIKLNQLRTKITAQNAEANFANNLNELESWCKDACQYLNIEYSPKNNDHSVLTN